MRPVGIDDIDDDEENSDENEDTSSEDKILERIHHDLKENLIIEKLVGALQEVASSSSSSSESQEKVEKRFSASLYNEPFSNMDRQLSEFKFQSGMCQHT